MFKITTSTDGGNTYHDAKGFEFGWQRERLIFATPQSEVLKFDLRNYDVDELTTWCEARLNNANNTKNRVKIVTAS